MDCEDLIVIVNEPDNLISKISEPESIIARTIEAVRTLGKSTYKIEFDTDATSIWAILSKFNGNITSATLSNITSYTIDGVVEALPFEIELNQVYLIEVVKSDPLLEASITLSVENISFDEILKSIDFVTGDGRWGYLLGDNTDVTTNRTVLKYDIDLLVRSNFLGGGLWNVDPLSATITLPELPVNGWFSRLLYVKDDFMLVSGGNTASFDKYFCKLNLLTDAVTDLDDVSGYSTKTGAYNGYPKTQLYDYVNSVVYFAYAGDITTVKYSDVSNLNLNTNVLNNDIQFPLTGLWGHYRKANFDPHQENFFVRDLVFNVDNHAIYSYEYAYSYSGLYHNPFINKFYHYTKNDGRNLGQFDHRGNFETSEGVTSGVRSATVTSYDKENNQFIQHTRVSVPSYKHHYRKYGVYSKGYYPIHHSPSEVSCLDAMYGKNYIHLAIWNTPTRLHMFDMNVDLSVDSAEFGYLDLPINCWSLYTNRLL